MNLAGKKIFLFDGLGALASMLFTGLLLPLFSEQIGLPPQLLYRLATIPLIYAIYSLSCYLFVKAPKPWMLLTIIIANFIYCIISGLIIFKVDTITSIGVALLLAEILILLGLIMIEFQVYRKKELL